MDYNAHLRQAEEHHEQLHQQRRAPDDPDVEPRQLPQYPEARELYQGHRHRDYHCQGEGNRREGDRYGQAREQNLPEGIGYKAKQPLIRHRYGLLSHLTEKIEPDYSIKKNPPNCKSAVLPSFPLLFPLGHI